jgi:hypothetical protein
LNTQGFSLQGVELLVQALNANFGINSHLRLERGLPTIYVPKREVPKLAELVLPFMHPSTHYKLRLSRD